MPDLDGPQRRRLREALMDAFPDWYRLEIMASEQLGLALTSISAPVHPLDKVTFDLIQWGRARDRLSQLVDGARRANPDNVKLFVVAQQLGLTSTSAKRSTLEKVVGRNNTFIDVATWRAELTRMEWRVCRIDHHGDGIGTGFLVGPDAVLTNHHVVEHVVRGAGAPISITCRFDYKVAEGAVVDAGETFALAEDWWIDGTPHSAVDLQPDPKSADPAADELDFALLRLDRAAGHQPPGSDGEAEARGWIELSGDTVDFAAIRVVAILQHPRRQPLKLALGMAEEIRTNGAGNRIRYTVPTEPGSSGAPVFDADWRLIALHHSGDPDSVRPEFNEAIPISEIVARPKVRAWLEELADDE